MAVVVALTVALAIAVTVAVKMVADVVDRPTEQSDLDALNIPMPPLQGSVRFEGIEFGYNPDQPLILHGVHFSMPRQRDADCTPTPQASCDSPEATTESTTM